eukprot:scaffold471273_cov23-Prasinocladus_malaysianus.AAC.1
MISYTRLTVQWTDECRDGALQETTRTYTQPVMTMMQDIAIAYFVRLFPLSLDIAGLTNYNYAAAEINANTVMLPRRAELQSFLSVLPTKLH